MDEKEARQGTKLVILYRESGILLDFFALSRVFRLRLKNIGMGLDLLFQYPQRNQCFKNVEPNQ